MDEQKMNCADCGQEFSFTPNPNFTRKYCPACGQKRKDSWKQKQNQTLPTANTQQASQPQASIKEYHLTDEAIRSNALSSAVKFNRNENISIDGILVLAKTFEKFIRNL